VMAAMQTGETGVTLSSLIDSCPAGAENVSICGVELDSRKVGPGDLFLAMPGDVHDGRQFIEQAVASGAAAVIAEAPVSGFVDAVSVPLIEVPELQHEAGLIASNFYAHPSHDIHMVGITGTNGKTTSSQLVAQLGRQLNRSCGVIGTLGSSLDDTVASTANTTPDPVSLQRQLASWRDRGVFAVAMEVSSHALVQGRVNGVQFETGVFTNLSQDHLDYHGSMDAYGRAKMSLFATDGLRHAVVNLDDPYAVQVLAVIPDGVQVFTYSAEGNPAADVTFEDIQFHDHGVTAKLRTPWGSGLCNSPLRGQFNLSNLAAAISAVSLAGEDLLQILDAVGALQPVAGRMQTIPNDFGLQLVVDYAHTPDALEQVLSALRPHIEGRLLTVFGCGGDRDRSKRSVMGRVACERSNRVFVTSDNPRGEEPDSILREIALGCTGDFELVVDRAEAIAMAMDEAISGDCVLVAGKGHEDYQILDGERIYFSDEQQLLDSLSRRRSS